MSPFLSLLSMKKHPKTLVFKRSRLILTPLFATYFVIFAQNTSAACNDYFVLQNGNEQIACLGSITPDSVELSLNDSAPTRMFSRALFQTILLSNGDTALPKMDCWPKPCPKKYAHLYIRTQPEDAYIRIDQGPWQNSPLQLDSLDKPILIESYAQAIGNEWFASRIYIPRPDFTDTASLSLKKTKTLLRIHSTPPGIELWINGKTHAQTPLEIENLRLDSLDLLAWHPTLGSQHQRIGIRPFHPTLIELKLNAIPSPRPFASQYKKIFQGIEWSFIGGSLLNLALYAKDIQEAQKLQTQLNTPSFQKEHWNKNLNRYNRLQESSQNKLLWSLGFGLASTLGIYPAWILNW